MDHDDYDDNEDQRRITRGARKREAEAMRVLGDALVALSPERLKEIPLPEEIRDAIRLAQRISAHGGRRRQLQLIARLLRETDAAPIQAALDRLNNRSALAIAEHHQTERWRERLLSEGDAALTEFLAAHPGADPQRLRQLVRGAQQEAAAGRPPKSARELFRLLRGHVGIKPST